MTLVTALEAVSITPSRFFDLPRELRDAVYHHLLTSTHVVTVYLPRPARVGVRGLPELNLLLVNRQCFIEYAEAFARTATLFFGRSDDFHHMRPLNRRPPLVRFPGLLAMAQRIEVTLDLWKFCDPTTVWVSVLNIGDRGFRRNELIRKSCRIDRRCASESQKPRILVVRFDILDIQRYSDNKQQEILAVEHMLAAPQRIWGKPTCLTCIEIGDIRLVRPSIAEQ
ncbi:hypothetical protein LTR66_008341 [Elasticomyces elasticus]|nr:hypothetical protein LTR66_008341 [Elasticomyces elasticus]